MSSTGINVGGTPMAASPTAARPTYTTATVTGWTGWVSFAAVLLVLIGSFHVIAGLVALFRDSYYYVPKDALLVKVDYTTWGWAHLILGAVAVLTGIGLFTGSIVARVLAVLFVMVSILANFAFINAYPIWSALIIGLDVLVIWAVTVHGSEMKQL